MNYEKFMLRAISNANFYKFTAKPNPVVGAILIKGEKIISEGYHEIFGQNHAEINAINDAKKKIDKEFKSFSELVLICTLEPCSHIGKTGSCAEAIAKTGIKKVVIGSIDPNPLVSGNGIKILKENGIQVEKGICSDLVEKQNRFFFFKQKNMRPYLTVKIASSADGKSHLNNKERTIITSEAARDDVQILRAERDAILTGGNTLRSDNPRMNARVNFASNQPKKILLSSKEFNKDEFHFFNGDSVDVHTSSNLVEVINSYKTSDICSILIEAGPSLVKSFIETNMIDEIIVYTSKKILGENGVNWFHKNKTIENYGFKLESSYKIDQDIKRTFIRNEKK